MLLNEIHRFGKHKSQELLKTLRLQHLPITTQFCLAIATGSMDKLEKLADFICFIKTYDVQQRFTDIAGPNVMSKQPFTANCDHSTYIT